MMSDLSMCFIISTLLACALCWCKSTLRLPPETTFSEKLSAGDSQPGQKMPCLGEGHKVPSTAILWDQLPLLQCPVVTPCVLLIVLLRCLNCRYLNFTCLPADVDIHSPAKNIGIG